MNDVSQRTTKNRPRASAPRSEQKRAEGAIDPFRGKCVRPLRGGRVVEQKVELVAVMEQCHWPTTRRDRLCDPLSLIYPMSTVTIA